MLSARHHQFRKAIHRCLAAADAAADATAAATATDVAASAAATRTASHQHLVAEASAKAVRLTAEISS